MFRQRRITRTCPAPTVPSETAAATCGNSGRQRLAGDRAARTQITRGVHPRFRLTGCDPQQLDQQVRGRGAPVLPSHIALLDLGELPVIGSVQAAPLHLDLAHQHGQFHRRQRGQIRSQDRINTRAQRRDRRELLVPHTPHANPRV